MPWQRPRRLWNLQPEEKYETFVGEDTWDERKTKAWLQDKKLAASNPVLTKTWAAVWDAARDAATLGIDFKSHPTSKTVVTTANKAIEHAKVTLSCAAAARCIFQLRGKNGAGEKTAAKATCAELEAKGLTPKSLLEELRKLSQ